LQKRTSSLQLGIARHVKNANIYFINYSIAKAPAVLSYSFLKLVHSEEAVIEDGEYNLPCYKSVSKTAKDEAKIYLQEPDALQKQLKKSEQLKVRVKLASTVVTQNSRRLCNESNNI
jgi:hypothetical protein